MNYKSDFADEFTYKKDEYKKVNKKYKHDVNYTCIDIKKDNNQFNKGKGRYISIDFKSLLDDKIQLIVSEVLIEALNKFYKIKKDDKILIVGLGNDKIIADSLGPSVADKIMVTNHLFTLLKDNKEDINRVCVFTPKVMGQTGLESADLVEAVTKLFKPNIIIVIDALATNSFNRINKVIQLSDTGIAPGSGVGNYRKQIDYKTLKVKVVAIGVATVVKANNIIQEYEDDDLILTPKSISEDIGYLSNIIASSINRYIHSDNLSN